MSIKVVGDEPLFVATTPAPHSRPVDVGIVADTVLVQTVEPLSVFIVYVASVALEFSSIDSLYHVLADNVAVVSVGVLDPLVDVFPVATPDESISK
mgnify:CR=1 FL=1